MRHVDNSGLTAPQKWADRAAKELKKLQEDAEDANKQLSFREMWREDAIRDRLIALIGEKCWYCETRFVRSPYHVDHYRPKSVVVGEAERRGYWWLAYDPANYRLACHHCNSGGARYGNQSAGPGKGARFPLLGQRASEGESLQGELPVLLDPVVAEDAELIGFDRQGHARRRPEHPYSDDELARDLCRVDETIRMLALNSDLLTESRSTLIERVEGLVRLYLANGGNTGVALYARTEIDCLTRTTAEWSAAAAAAERLALLAHDRSGDDAALVGGAGGDVDASTSGGTEPPAATAAGHRVDLRTLVASLPAEAFSAGRVALTGQGKRGPARATLMADGSIICFQRPLDTPTSAARLATGDDQVDGWTFWSLTVDGTTRTLSDLRDSLIAQAG
ncbi:HNH endonuclease [Streptomyces sp. MMS21 TC-5]|uniref:restriction system modified-DNA reader domain-containing protein n=1 Tax=Streptomyces sp. MMS21 TC-5 TaxID=2925833 RepID=UPI001F6222A5|nr:HNH endonuclease [Streptomyces sp. MMS21 TC-5]MCI4085645.1 HNH endonuclease [Streptomyces sp. MMS21 TC-5]